MKYIISKYDDFTTIFSSISVTIFLKFHLIVKGACHENVEIQLDTYSDDKHQSYINLLLPFYEHTHWELCVKIVSLLVQTLSYSKEGKGS